MDEFFMRIALDLASAVDGQTSPNPPVGAVIVKNGRIIGLGAHLKQGTEHAEIHALRSCIEPVQGATVYVTLEPCSFFGKTPPCVNALVEARVSRVVIGAIDRNPLVSENGIQTLKENGIVVDMCSLNGAVDSLYRPFRKFITQKQPYVIIKSAITMDGKMASSSGDSKWISSPESRQLVHEIRNKCDAILVGVGTVLSDNPSLTTRLQNGGRNPVRIVLDRNFRIPIHSNVIQDKLSKTIIVTGESDDVAKRQVLESMGVDVWTLDYHDVTWTKVLLNRLATIGVIRLLVEGGSRVNTLFFESKAIDEFHIFLSPKLLGGQEAPSLLAGTGILNVSDAVRLNDVRTVSSGDDIYISGVPIWD